MHTPFPSSELFRLLPYRTELLIGLLSANLLGFHVESYRRHFFSACVQTLGLEVTDRGVLAAPVGGVYAHCISIPIGIDSKQFIDDAASQQVQEAAAKLRREMGDRRVRILFFPLLLLLMLLTLLMLRLLRMLQLLLIMLLLLVLLLL